MAGPLPVFIKVATNTTTAWASVLIGSKCLRVRTRVLSLSEWKPKMFRSRATLQTRVVQLLTF